MLISSHLHLLAIVLIQYSTPGNLISSLTFPYTISNEGCYVNFHTVDASFDLCSLKLVDATGQMNYTVPDGLRVAHNMSDLYPEDYYYYFNILYKLQSIPSICLDENKTHSYCPNQTVLRSCNSTLIPIKTGTSWAYQIKYIYGYPTNCWPLSNNMTYTDVEWSLIDPTDVLAGVQITYTNGEYDEFCGQNRKFNIQIQCNDNLLFTPENYFVYEYQPCEYTLSIPHQVGCPIQCERYNNQLCSGNGICEYDFNKRERKCFCFGEYKSNDCSRTNQTTEIPEAFANHTSDQHDLDRENSTLTPTMNVHITQTNNIFENQTLLVVLTLLITVVVLICVIIVIKRSNNEKKLQVVSNALAVIIGIGHYEHDDIEYSDIDGYLEDLPVDKDVENLTQLFNNLNYTVLPKEPKLYWTADDIITFLKEDVGNTLLDDEEQLQYDSLIVCVSCHGQENVIISSDSKTIEKNVIHRIISAENPVVRNIPRLFVFDSCEGIAQREYVRKETIYDEEKDNDKGVTLKEISSGYEWTNESLKSKNPDYKLVCVSAANAGYQAKCHVNNGSYLINGFVQKLKCNLNKKGNKTLQCIFEEVQQELHDTGKQQITHHFNNNTSNVVFKKNNNKRCVDNSSQNQELPKYVLRSSAANDENIEIEPLKPK
eukprot:414821_1